MPDAEHTTRDSLGDRRLPQMTLSTESNPLTAFVPLPKASAAERVARRFAIDGNAIVTGGAGFIGLETVRALLERGASGVSIFDIADMFAMSGEKIDTLRSEFANAKIVTQTVDVTDEGAIEVAVEETAKALGSVGVLVCMAGIVSAGQAIDLSPSSWRRVLEVNTTGTWLCAQSAAKRMIAQGKGGSIVFTASISGHFVNYPQPQISYNVSKAGVIHLTHSLAAKWAQYGIRVNSVSPGYMDTILNHGDGLEEGRKLWYSRCPMGRMGNPEELMGAIILLSSKFAGRYMTGTDILVDGGQTLF